jgi:hypothetical protein
MRNEESGYATKKEYLNECNKEVKKRTPVGNILLA